MAKNKNATSLIPRDLRRDVEISRVVRDLSQRVGYDRHDHDLGYSLRNFVKTHRLEADEATISLIETKAMERILADTVYDSEANQAYRALFTTFMEMLPTEEVSGYPVYTSINIQGWIPGESVWIRGERFSLTGRPCPQCGVNPEAHGHGGGVRCVDTVNCRWWYCA